MPVFKEKPTNLPTKLVLPFNGALFDQKGDSFSMAP
jgi:hypothetical protein